MKEAKRYPGSEWLKNHPAALERFYDFAQSAFKVVYPPMKRVSPHLASRFITWGEHVSKAYVWNCQMCGQCILHSTGMTCPMNCPKNLRNGPCGGVRANGHCEVIPEMPCVWVQAWERSQQMPKYGQEILWLEPPVNRQLQNSSAWINWFDGTDAVTPPGWEQATRKAYAEKAETTETTGNGKGSL
jgi:hypothetical protein